MSANIRFCLLKNFHLYKHTIIEIITIIFECKLKGLELDIQLDLSIQNPWDQRFYFKLPIVPIIKHVKGQSFF